MGLPVKRVSGFPHCSCETKRRREARASSRDDSKNAASCFSLDGVLGEWYLIATTCSYFSSSYET